MFDYYFIYEECTLELYSEINKRELISPFMLHLFKHTLRSRKINYFPVDFTLEVQEMLQGIQEAAFAEGEIKYEEQEAG